MEFNYLSTEQIAVLKETCLLPHMFSAKFNCRKVYKLINKPAFCPVHEKKAVIFIAFIISPNLWQFCPIWMCGCI
jgi:hypothetical protein